MNKCLHEIIAKIKGNRKFSPVIQRIKSILIHRRACNAV